MIKVHFLNVGHGDCTIVEFPSGRKMMIDINNSKALDDKSEKELVSYYGIDPIKYSLSKAFGINLLASEKGYNIELTDPIDYYKLNWGNENLFRFVCTHPDMDHLSGIHRLHKQEDIAIYNFWDSEHTFTKSDEDLTESKYDKKDWETYEKIRKGGCGPKILHLERHANAQFFNEDGIYILASTTELKKLAHEKEEANHLSYVLMLIHGKSKVILGGDATPEVWEDILNNFSYEDLKSSVLKAAHHGRESGYHEGAVRAINPEYTIVSVGKKPSTDASDLYKKHSKNVWSTRWKGNIILDCYEDGSIVPWTQYDR